MEKNENIIESKNEIKTEDENHENPYKIIENLGKTKKGELFLATFNEKLCMIYKIELKSQIEKDQIIDEIKKINSLKSEFIVKINNYFYENQNMKEYFCIVIDNYKYGNLSNLIQKNYPLSTRMIWRIFLQLALGIKAFHENDMILKDLHPGNIYLDDEMNIKIGSYGLISDFLKKENLNTYEFYSPEIINGGDFSKESDIWSLGFILYKLVFKDKPFNLKNNIFNYNDINNGNCDTDFKYVLSKLLCNENKRVSINKLLIDMRIKKKLLEVNLFDEVVEENIKSK